MCSTHQHKEGIILFEKKVFQSDSDDDITLHGSLSVVPRHAETFSFVSKSVAGAKKRVGERERNFYSIVVGGRETETSVLYECVLVLVVLGVYDNARTESLARSSINVRPFRGSHFKNGEGGHRRTPS